MSEERLHLYPQSYFEVKDRLVFFLDPSRIDEQEMQLILKELLEVEVLPVAGLAKDDDGKNFYIIYVQGLSLMFREGKEQRCYYCSHSYHGIEFAKRKRGFLEKDFFTIVPSGGITVVYAGKSYPGDPNAHWDMNRQVYSELNDALTNYFGKKAVVSSGSEQEVFHLSDNFEKWVLEPYQASDDTKKWVTRDIERNNIAARYLYHLFTGFAGGGYEKAPAELANIVADMTTQNPDDQAQMEVFVKGALTEDVLLALTPEGTNRISVIRKWVEYYVSHHKRVLISAKDDEMLDALLLALEGLEGEIVRIGTSKTVTKAVQSYLPENHDSSKIAAEIQENHGRVLKEFEFNRAELTSYEIRVKSVLAMIMKLKQQEKQWKERSAKFKACMEEILATKMGIDSEFKLMVTILDEKAHKSIFLEHLSKQKFTLRRSYKDQERKAREELEKTEAEMRVHQREYGARTLIYQQVIEKTIRARNAARKEGLFENYGQTYEAVAWEFEKMKGEKPTFFPALLGEFGAMYSVPKVNMKDFTANEDLFQKELAVIATLRTLMDQTKDALVEWNKDVVKNEKSVFLRSLAETKDVVFASCQDIMECKELQNARFDVAIIDDAGEMTMQRTLPTMIMAKKNLLLGDIRGYQLQRSEREEETQREPVGDSFFEFLYENMRKASEERLLREGKDRGAFLRPAIEDYRVREGRPVSKPEALDMIAKVVRDERKAVILSNMTARVQAGAGIVQIIG